MAVRTFRIFMLLVATASLAAIVWLMTANQANAQCGSQASSCKNCHEVQALKSVNNDGTGWHQSHAFGDFCVNCHAGNAQVTGEGEAHTAMVAPLSDLKSNCAACHPNDLQARGDVYAKALGVTVDAGGPPSSTGSGSGSASPTQPSSAPTNSPSSAVVVSEPNVVDYAQRYDQQVSGALNVNWGDVTLIVLIVALAVGGGGFVYWNERRLRRLTAGTQTKVNVPVAASLNPADYPSEVVALLPQIAKLNPAGIHALKRLLTDPEAAAELLQNLSKLDPDLVRRIRTLDRDSRNLLMGLAGD
jgi:hypothetical protein